MITNHGYLDNPTFRGMRQHLMNTFDEIYVLNLHGNSLKKETCPDGSPDENVFDIPQGVAIALFVKRSPCQVFHADLWGRQEGKYAWPEGHAWKTTEWREIRPASAVYLFVPRGVRLSAQYSRFIQITEVFPVNMGGIQTHRDHFVVDFERDALRQRVQTFLTPTLPDEPVREAFDVKDNLDWKLAEKRRLLQEDTTWEKERVHYLCRPFDKRWLFYHLHAIDFCREKVMRHLVDEGNVALLVNRRNHEFAWRHAFVTSCPASAVAVEVKEGFYVMPLKLLPGRPMEAEAENVAGQFLDGLAQNLGRQARATEVFSYVYAVLYAPTYQERYAEFPRLDFPRIPFTSDPELFKKMAALGERLVELHLLRSTELDPPLTRFQGEGDSRVISSGKKGLRYDADSQRVYINPSQYFAPVPPEVWEHAIGGYQVCHRWLKDRRDRVLTLDEIRTYCRVVTALAKTIEIQGAIDPLYPAVEAEIIPPLRA